MNATLTPQQMTSLISLVDLGLLKGLFNTIDDIDLYLTIRKNLTAIKDQLDATDPSQLSTLQCAINIQTIQASPVNSVPVN